jgi:hypothetical protein
MRYLLTSELKQRTGQILDAAVRKPQFVMRGGTLFVIARVKTDKAPEAAAAKAAHLTASKAGLTPEERRHRNAILANLDDSKEW